MAFPIVFVWFLIGIFIFRHHLRKSSKAQEEVTAAFWKKEEESLVVRKKELVEDDYIHPGLTEDDLKDEAYYKSMDAQNLYRYVTYLKEVMAKPMVNFEHTSNADLRLSYGTANLTIIEAYEENYNAYIATLFKLGKGLHEAGDDSLAITLLNEGIRCGTDNRQHYLLLAQIHKAANDDQAINALYQKAEGLHSLTKGALLKALDQLRQS